MLKTPKHQAFVEDPIIRYKSVESLPGITPVYGRRLRDAGFDTAEKVLEQYRSLNKNENRFALWLGVACGANSRVAAQCFNGLNEWYHAWGRDAHLPKTKKSSSTPSIQNSLSTRMLLEQKMLHCNFNPSGDRLRSLAQGQAISMVDISRSQQWPRRTIPEKLNKSNLNISHSHNLDEKKKTTSNQYHSLRSLTSPVQKSVNFKENEIIDIKKPRKFEIPISPSRTISPILKSRSITPENKMAAFNLAKSSAVKSFDVPDLGNVVKKLNNLSSRIDNNGKKPSPKTSVKRAPIATQNKLAKNSNTKSDAKHDARSKQQMSSKNIERYFDEANKFYGYPNMRVPPINKDHYHRSPWLLSYVSAPRNTDTFTKQREDDMKRDLLEQRTNTSPDLQHYDKESTDISDKIRENYDPKDALENHPSSSESDFGNSNGDDDSLEVSTEGLVEFPNDSEISGDEECSTTLENLDSLSGSGTGGTHEEINEHRQYLPFPTLKESEDECNDETPCDENSHKNLLSDSGTNSFSHDDTDIDTDQKINNIETTKRENESNFDNSNEDSGLDVSTSGLIEFPTASEISDDESSTLFGNAESVSGDDTDRTYEVNETTDAESECNFVESSKTTSQNTESILKNESETDQEEGRVTGSSMDDAKKNNVRLFCDMLSSDLEQLPMDKFRKLKLKILQVVYAELDECGLK